MALHRKDGYTNIQDWDSLHSNGLLTTWILETVDVYSKKSNTYQCQIASIEEKITAFLQPGVLKARCPSSLPGSTFWICESSTFQALNQSRYQSCWVYRYFTLKHQVCVLYPLFSVWRLESLQLLRSQPCGDTWSKMVFVTHHICQVDALGHRFWGSCKNHGETLPFSHQTMASSKTHETALNENTTGWWPGMDALVLPRLMWETSLGGDDVHKWS